MAGKGLGRGLDSLFGIMEDRQELTSGQMQELKADGQVIDINLSLIDNNPKQPRRNFDAASLSELAESIKNHGVIQPIIVTKRNDRFLIVAGERRFRACKLAGQKVIPAIVRDYTNSQIKEVALLENIQREDLNPIECARAMQELLNDYDWTQEVLAERLGKSRSAIANTLRLLALTPEVIAMVESGKLSAGHARSLVVVANPEVQIKLAMLATTRKVTVRDLEKAVKESQAPPKQKKQAPLPILEVEEFKHNLQRKLSTKVEIVGNEKKGKIVITYSTKDDLQRLYDFFKNN